MWSCLLFFAACEKEAEIPLGTLSEQDIKVFLEERFIDVPYQAKEAKDFTFQTLDGKTGKLSDLRGEVVFLNFWATWCVPCRYEMPDMEELHHLMKGEKFRMLAVSFKEPEATVREFLEKYPYSFDVIPDEKNEIGKLYYVTGLPTTLIIGPQGKILGKATGPRNWKDPSLIRFFKQIIRS